MASEIDEVLEAFIATVKASVPELNGYAHVVPSVTLPAIMAYPPDEINYGETFDDSGTMLFVGRIYVQQRQDGNDQKQLNTYLSRDGAKSVYAAIRDNPRLGGAVADARIVQATNFGNWPVGSVTYLGVEIRVIAMLL